MTPLMFAAFVAGCSLVLLVALLLEGRRQRIDARLLELAGKPGGGSATAPPGTVSRFTRSALPKIGGPLLPQQEQERTRLQARLIHAGLYGRHALPLFLGVKMLLMMLPAAAGLLAGLAGLLPLLHGLLFGLIGSVLGILLPSFWLDWRKNKRQSELRRALPDALDVMVICLEGGLSLQGAFQRVAGELGPAHPLLANEMLILEREMQLARSPGEAMREFADRSDLEEVRSLASVILQAERFGAGISNSLRVHADSLRLKRLQRAEELAHTAATKMIFPTVLCIFPAILIVVAGPAISKIAQMLSSFAG